MSRNFYLRTYVNFTRVNKIEATYGGSRVNVKVRSSFTFARGLSYIASISFTRVNFTCIRTEKLRESGNELIHCLLYLRTYNLRAYARKNYATVEIHLQFCLLIRRSVKTVK